MPNNQPAGMTDPGDLVAVTLDDILTPQLLLALFGILLSVWALQKVYPELVPMYGVIIVIGWLVLVPQNRAEFLAFLAAIQGKQT